MSTRNYAAVADITALAGLVGRLVAADTAFGFDIETGYDGPDREKGSVHPETAKIVGISFTNSTDWARYVPLGHDNGLNLDNYQAARLLWTLLQTGQGVAHNVVFELRHLSRWFLKYLSDDPEVGQDVRRAKGYFPIRSDSMVEAYLMAEYERFGLKSLVSNMFEHQMIELYELFTDLPVNRRKYLRFNTLDPTDLKVIEYACEDSLWCLAIHLRYYPQVSDRLLYRVDMGIVREVIPPMEDYGIAYDWALMRRTADELRIFRDKYNAEIMAELSELVGEPVAINLGSYKQVSETLFERLGYRTTVYTNATRDLEPDERKMSTGDIALTKLAAEKPIVRKILKWRNQTKLLGTYLDKYEDVYNYADDGRAHPNHLTAFVITGRFAHSDPNYAQSPKKYHFDLNEGTAAHERGEEPPPGTCFTFNFRDVITSPQNHYIFGFDLSQAELRAIAGEAQEPALLKAFAEGVDVHCVTASLVLNVPIDELTKDQRDVGKLYNFGLLYGMSVKGLADRLGISVDEAQELMDKYFASYSAIKVWGDRQIEHGRKYGYVVGKFGRKLPIWEYTSDKRWIYQKGDRACVNYPIQGAATGDYVRIAMLRAVRAIREAGLADKMHLVMNIHDALEFYVHRSIAPETAWKILNDAVIFPVTGWPVMKADWHLAKRWGSPTEIEFSADGVMTVAGEPATAALGPPEREGEADLPEVTQPPVVGVQAPQAAPGRRVIVKLTEMPTSEGFDAFVELVKDTPGPNTLVLSTPSGVHDWPLTSALDLDDQARLSTMLGPVTLLYDSDEVDLRTVGSDLSW